MAKRKVAVDNGKGIWHVPYTDAKRSVVINGSLLEALLGSPGKTYACHLANCAMSNKPAFPHAVHLPTFTRTMCYIVDKVDLPTGQPLHCVRYKHYLGDITDLNDTDPAKVLLRKHPEIAMRDFTLHKPTKSKPSKSKSKKRGASRGTHEIHTKRPYVLKGAFARAQKAGLI